MLRIGLVITALAIMLSFALPSAYATTYYGPSATIPTAISPGSEISITLGTTSCSTSSCFVAPPTYTSNSGVNYNQDCNAGVCLYPLQACTDSSAFYVLIHEITVTDPEGNAYNLGSAATSGLFWPAAFGGAYSIPSNGNANALNITAGQSDTIYFGTGQTGSSGASFPSEDYVTSGAPFTPTSDTAGPYYWWTGAGNANGAGLRLDQTSITPTSIQGTYTVDIEGVAVCGPTTTAIQYVIAFDTPITVTTPQFGAPVIAVASVAFVLLMLARRGTFGKKMTPFPKTQ